MALQLGALYAALRHAAGVTDDQARQAAEEMATFDGRLNSIDTKIAVLTAITTINTALILGVFWLCFNILARLPK